MSGMPTRTIALVDGFDDGHHLTYQRQMVRAWLAQGHRVIALVPDPARAAGRGADPGAQLAAYPFRHTSAASPFWRLRKVWRPLAAWQHAARAVRAAERESGWRVDLVFFAWLDDYIVGLAPLCRFIAPVLFRYPWSGLFFHPWHLRAPAGDAEAHYAVSTGMLRTRRCRGVAVLDEGVAAQLEERIRKPVIALPDATDDALPPTEPERVRRLDAAARGRKVIGLMGELSRRKGVVAFLRAAAA